MAANKLLTPDIAGDTSDREAQFMERENEKVKKPKTAVALSYDPNDEAPRIIAAGKGILAEKIIEKAREADVPLHQDNELADTLSRLDIGDMIPPELYEVVAEILVFVDAMDKVKARGSRS